MWEGSTELGNLLQQRREEMALSREKASLICGTNPTYLARLERGEPVSPPTPMFLQRVAEAYQLRIDQLATAVGAEIVIPDDLRWADDVEVHVRFRRLVERIRPFALDATGMQYYSPVHKAWGVSLGFQAERYALEVSPGRSLRDSIRDRIQGARTAEEIEQMRAAELGLMTWQGDPGFGGYLRRRKERSGLTIREIGSRMDVSHSMVANLFKQRWKRAPSRDLLDRLAAALEIDIYDLMERAGYRSAVPTSTLLGANTHELFRLVVVDLGLRPEGMTELDLALWSGVQKQQMVDLAERVDLHVREIGEPCVEAIVAQDDQE